MNPPRLLLQRAAEGRPVRAAGLQVVAAGKDTKYLPRNHASTPETVWDFHGLMAEQAQAGGMNPRMFNSFADGTKSGIEMAAIANATELNPHPDGAAEALSPRQSLRALAG